MCAEDSGPQTHLIGKLKKIKSKEYQLVKFCFNSEIHSYWLCVYVCAHAHIRRHVKVRGKPQMFALIHCLIRDRNLLFITAYARLAGPPVPRDSHVLPPSCYSSTGITDVCDHIQFYMGSGNPNSGPQAYTAIAEPLGLLTGPVRHSPRHPSRGK